MQTSLLEINGVTILYNKIPAVKNVSFQLEEGKVLGIVGESGSGKSTILKSIVGIMGQAGKIESGTISYQGLSLVNPSKGEHQKIRGKEIGCILQDSKASFCPIKTIESHLYEALSIKGKAEKELRYKEALQILKQLNFIDAEKVIKSYPYELSGGMNQRAAIMIAMMQKPSLLLADEPTSALDTMTQRKVVSTMLALKKERNTAMIVVTHNIGLAAYLSDDILVMKNGVAVEYAKTHEVLYHPKDPYTKRLLEAVPRLKRG